MKKILLLALSVVTASCGGGGGGGGSSDSDSSIPSFDGVYEGRLNRVINTCEFTFDWEGAYSVEHNAGQTTLTLQVGEKYPQRHSGTVTSPDSFLVELAPETSGKCTTRASYTFDDITAASARVRWTIEYVIAKNCLIGYESNGSCTVAFEGVLPRS